ncbi:recombinase family protein [Spirosoma agri]|nr:hypothetical protein [Spirosoma agri]
MPVSQRHSLKELFTLVDDFQSKGIGFRSLNDTVPRWLLILPLRKVG